MPPKKTPAKKTQDTNEEAKKSHAEDGYCFVCPITGIKLKKGCCGGKGFKWFLGLYAIAAAIGMSPAYHMEGWGGVAKNIVFPPLGWVDAYHYYGLSGHMPVHFTDERKRFLTVLKGFEAAGQISRKLPNVSMARKEVMLMLNQKSVDVASDVPATFLDWAHPKLTHMFQKELVQGVDSYTKAMTLQDQEGLKKANKGIVVWAAFWEKNRADIFQKLRTYKEVMAQAKAENGA